MDFLKNIFSNKGSQDAAQKTQGYFNNLFNRAPVVKAPVAQTPVVQGPVRPPVSAPQTQSLVGGLQSKMTQPVQPPKIVSQPPVNSTIDLQRQMATTNSFNVTPPQTSPAAAVSPDNTTSALRQARKQLEEQLLGSLQPSTQSEELAKFRNETAKLTLKQKKEFEQFKEQGKGMTSAVYSAEEQKFRQKQVDEMADRALIEQSLVSGVQLSQDEQKMIKENLKTITELTNGDMIGSLETDQVTGDVYAYFRDPSTGQISQQTVGKTNVQPDLTYQNIGGNLVALDRGGNIVKTIGPAGSGSGGFGGFSGFGGGAIGGEFGVNDAQNTVLSFAATLPTVGERDGLSGAIGSIREAQKMVNLIGNQNTATGILSGLGAKLSRPFGLTSQEQDNLNASMVNYRAQFIKAISGAAVTDQERKNLMQTLPSEFKTTQANIAGFYSTLGYLDSIYSGKYGFDLKSLMPVEVQQNLIQAQTGGTIKPFTSLGTSGNAFADLNQ